MATTTIDPTTCLTIQQAAAQIGLGEQALYRWARKGAGRGLGPLPVVRMHGRDAVAAGLQPGKTYVAQADLDAYVESIATADATR